MSSSGGSIARTPADQTLDPTLVAGAIAGAVALVIFVVLHAMWIVPVWWLLAFLPLTAVIGVVAALPFRDLAARGALPPWPLDGVAFGALLLATLLPTVVYGVVAGPLPVEGVTVRGLVPPLLLAAPAGALAGWLLAGTLRGAGAFALAALVLALTLGHNLPFFPVGSPGWGRTLGLLAACELGGGLAFAIARHALGVTAGTR